MPPMQGDDALHQLQSNHSKLLDKIDDLRTIGIGGLVELPQLIVCGNQSSGKSSVLEAISRVRFPAKSSVCTRFATEVILRRRQSPSIKVSIEPGPSRIGEQERRNLRNFAPDVFSNSDDLPKLIERAEEHMGISRTVSSGFSDDILKVEISGPDKPELTLVDLPGLYYSTSEDQGEEGKKIVRSLTEKYMENSRSIILAVISAKSDYHIQEVLNIAAQFDPQRERTLGIITQPDTLEANSRLEDMYLQFVKNEKVRLLLGWHVLRNRSFEIRDISDDARDEMEKAFFNKGRWTSISREWVGIDSLRRRLSLVLSKLIQQNIPGLIKDIQQEISERQQKLSKLGPARSTLQQQRGFLLDISRKFERLIGQSLNGIYADEFFGGLDSTKGDRRLRAVIRELNEFFAEAMTVGGCRRKILEVGEEPMPSTEIEKLRTNCYMRNWIPIYAQRSTLEREISEQARQNRGIELPGNANQLLVGSLFRDQSKPWEELARDHLMTAWEATRYLACRVLQHLTDEYTYSILVGAVLEPEIDSMQTALQHKLGELTAYTKRGHPLPVGTGFLTRIQKVRGERQLASLKSKLMGLHEQSPIFLGPSSIFSLHDLGRVTSDLEQSRDQFAATEIIDQMQAYYDTAIVTFVENVAILGIENCLLYPLQSIFTSETVNNMDDSKIRELASEPSFIQEERGRLTQELEKLETGLQTLKIFDSKMPSLRSLNLTVSATSGPAAASATPSISNRFGNSKPALKTYPFQGTRPSSGFMSSLGNRQSTATGQPSPNVSQSAPAVGISSKNTSSTTTGLFGTNQARTSSTAPPKSLFGVLPNAGYGSTPPTTGGLFGSSWRTTPSVASSKPTFGSSLDGSAPPKSGGLFGSSRASTPLTTTETPFSTNPQSTSVNSSLPVTAEGQLPSRSQPPSGTSSVNTTSVPAQSTVSPWRASKA